MKFELCVSITEFQNKILDAITSGEVDKFYKCTQISEEYGDKYKQAMIYGMTIASMMTSQCNIITVASKEDVENEIGGLE